MNEHYKVLNALRRDHDLAAELPSSSPDLYSWVGVYPLDLDKDKEWLCNKKVKISNTDKPIYCIRLFEAEKKLIDQDVWVCESDLKNKKDFVVQGEEALFAKLSELNIDPDKLEMPCKSNYPI
ncbi:hypothetical protein [Candidatus Finniella inopinata]|uniref:Uncharacterized protein n=1 Tax=Candidatus Finniella inopinata TaxID=1696036 RepID=A0A4Q7DGU8_9PROT|nr:hypothetical protein [Candidatus Finniella inopinata]RZI45438.1 hypothetical protein EQU50_07050 [Candidatus Finniella inopinata]